MLERRGRSLGYRVWYLYEFFMKRLQRMKVAPAPQLTPLEYAISRERQLEFMDQGTDGVTFLEVSRLYMDVTYGAYQPTDDDYDRVVRFYRAFFKNARKQSGWPKWVFWRYWRI